MWPILTQTPPQFTLIQVLVGWSQRGLTPGLVGWKLGPDFYNLGIIGGANLKKFCGLCVLARTYFAHGS